MGVKHLKVLPLNRKGVTNIKGILLAGGSGTRLHPLTKIVSKQLLPVFDKPLVYYPLSTIMLANIKEVLLIVAPSQETRFKELLGDGTQFGISITYKVQPTPSGIAQSLLLAQDFLEGQKSMLVLGDNIFHGPTLGRRLANFWDIDGAQAFGYHVKDPRPYGVAKLDENGNVEILVEKPNDSISNIAIPGIYFFDESAPIKVGKLKPSKRGELEILDLLQIYLNDMRLKIEMLPRGTAWFDSGTFEDLFEASSYVRVMQKRTGDRVGDPFEIAKSQGWI